MSLNPLGMLALLAAFAGAVPAQGPPAARTRTIVARIVDARGAPLAGAGLAVGLANELLTSDALDRPRVRSAADGRLTARVTLPTSKEYEVQPSLLIAAAGKVSVTNGHLQTLYSAALDETVDLGDVVLFDAVTLRGRLVDAAGKPVAEVRVTATDAILIQRSQNLPGAAVSGRSVVLSDSLGLFALPCVHDRGLELLFTKEGWFQRRVRPVGRETPLTIEMQQSGFVAGKALDAAGRGLATRLTITWECGASASVSSGEDGSFRATLLQPGRYRIRSNRAGGSSPELQSEILEGPRAGLELRRSGAGGVRVVVRAVAAGSGKELETFSAAGFWYASQQTAGELLLHGSPQLVASDLGRRVTLSPQGTQRSGNIVVVAPGHAPEAVPVQLDDADAPKELTVALGPEASVAGKVVDDAGKPLAGVRVWAVAIRANSFTTYPTIPPNAVLSASDGTFRVGGIAAGYHCVQALREDLLVPDPERVEVEAAKIRDGIVIKMKPGTTLRVELTGPPIDSAWMLRLDDPSANRGLAMVAGPGGIRGGAKYSPPNPGLTARIGPDGTFRFERLEAKTYRLVLLQPAFTRLARAIELPLGSVTVPLEKTSFDLAKFTPARIQGSVDVADSGIARDRLVVIATPHVEQWNQEAIALRGLYAAATLDSAGTFGLDLAPGNYDLCVADVGTGLVLFASEEAIAAARGKEATANVVLRTARVRIKLVPESKGTPLRVASLAVTEPSRQSRPRDYMRQGVLSYSGEGMALEPGQTEVELWLPGGDFAVKVFSRAGWLCAGSSYRQTELASDEVTVPERGQLEVTLKVAAPPLTPDLEK